MIRRLLIPLVGSGLLLAASAGSAFAKCEGPNPPAFCSEVIVSLGASGSGLVGGSARSLVISVTQGEQPFEATGVVLTFTAADGSVVRVPATATAQPGLWRAEVTLPDAGIWTAYAQVVTSEGPAYRLFIDRVRVSEPPTLPVQPPVGAPPVAPAPPILPIALILAGLAAVALLGQTTRTRRQATAVGSAAEPTASAAAADRA